MILSYDEAVRLFRSGEFGTLANAFEKARPTDSRLDPQVRILVAHALARVGFSERARELLPQDVVSPWSLRQRAMAHSVLGLASRGVGEFSEALAHFQVAIRLSQDQPDLEEAAWAQLHLFRHLLDSGRPDLSQAMIPTVRAVVRRAGAPQVTAYLHVVIAALEGQRGRLDEGLRHCEVAQSVLQMAPNAWIQCAVLRNRASIALAGSHLLSALDAIRSVETIAKTHFLAREVVENDANLGYVATAARRT